MMRLTVRSGKDGRFLARVVDTGGRPFALDFGDRRIIDDARQRILHGFTMWRMGELINALPQDPDLIDKLAEFYAGEGLLVALEEPTWPGRDQTLDERLPDLDARQQDDPLEDAGSVEAPTDVVNFDELTDLGELLEEATEMAELRPRPAPPAPPAEPEPLRLALPFVPALFPEEEDRKTELFDDSWEDPDG